MVTQEEINSRLAKAREPIKPVEKVVEKPVEEPVEEAIEEEAIEEEEEEETSDNDGSEIDEQPTED